MWRKRAGLHSASRQRPRPAATRIYNSSLTRLANDRAELIGKTTMDRLCAFFDCQPGDLFIYVSPVEPERRQ